MLKPKTKTFLFEYSHQGSNWVLEIPADDMADAQERVNKLPQAQPLGELMYTIPASGGWLVKLACVLRNFFRTR